MINIPQSVRNEYKDFNREIEVYGVLYLASKRLSRNLFNYRAYNNSNTNLIIDNNINGFKIPANKYSVNSGKTLSDYCPNCQVGKTYYLSANSTSTNAKYIYLYGSANMSWNYNTSNVMTQEMLNSEVLFYGIYPEGTGSSSDYITISNIQIVEGTTPIDYEPYGEYVYDYTTFSLTEENECKILSFNINEKADVYYTSVPYNTMTIEVDNEKGYFTDYDPDNIIDLLNEDCYVDLYMKINNGNYYKIMSMNFDKIKYSDYQKAKLSFYSNLARIKEYDLKDKNGIFAYDLDIWRDIKQYVLDNYNINLVSDHPYITDNVDRFIIAFEDYKNLNELLLSTATSELGSLYGAEALLTSDYENNIMLKAISNEEKETITTDLQLEKPIIKREDTYKGVYYNWHRSDNYVATNETYSYSILGKLNSTRDTFIIVDDYYKLSDITINDITSSANVNVSIVQIASNYKNMLSLVVEGNINDNYDITINKTNMYKNEPTELVKWPLGQTNDTSKILEIEDKAPIEYGPYVFLFIKKPLKSKVEAKIMGLPYLEIGDTIYITQNNRYVKMFITEINTNYNDGLTQTIKGYELDWSHKVTGTYEQIYGDLNTWEGLLPADDLYPRDDLYPYSN